MIVSLGFFLSLLSFWYLFFPPIGISGMNLVYGVYGHSHIADYLLLSIPITIGFLIEKKGSKLALVLTLALGIETIAMILSFSRGAIGILLVVVTFLVLWYQRHAQKRQILLLAIICSLIAAVIITTLLPLDKTKTLDSRRINYWSYALDGFKERPLVGFGPGTFEIIALKYHESRDWTNFAHSFYLQTLSESGIFSLLAFIGFLLLSLRKRLVRLGEDPSPILIGAIVAVLASSFHSFVDYDWHFPAVFLTFLFLLALIVRPIPDDRPARFPKGHRVFLALLISLSLPPFIFGLSRIGGEYFSWTHNYKMALTLSPWPPHRFRQLGDGLIKQKKGSAHSLEARYKFLIGDDPATNYWLGDHFVEENDYRKAITYYRKALDYNPLGNYMLYDRVAKLYDLLKDQKGKWEFYNWLTVRLGKTNNFKNSGNGLGKAFYFIGDDYLKHRDYQKALYWWQKATEALPQWSYVYLEVASIQYKTAHSQAVERTLLKCTQFFFPKMHCQAYFKKPLESPGYWRDKIRLISED